MSSVSPRPDGGAAIFAPDETSSNTFARFFQSSGLCPIKCAKSNAYVEAMLYPIMLNLCFLNKS